MASNRRLSLAARSSVSCGIIREHCALPSGQREFPLTELPPDGLRARHARTIHTCTYITQTLTDICMYTDHEHSYTLIP